MWQSLIGHDATVAPLTRAIDTQTIAQAYLFSGPQGVGKSLAAKLFAETVVGGATRDNHPDIIWLRVLPDKSEIGVEQWRQVEAKVQFQALEGTHKFILIDDAERMSLSVANACLKTLEEPPSNTHFILISHDANRLLPTIRSRCQQLVFAPLSQAVVEKWLQQHGADAATAKRVAVLAQGSLQRAERLAKPEVMSQLDALMHDLQLGMTPNQVLSHAATLATLAEMPEVLDALAFLLRDVAVKAPGAHALNRIRAIEQSSQYLATKGANKELLLNELFISLATQC